jgi:two-component sensor histidine kinase
LTVPLRVNRTTIGVLQAVDKTINRFAETDLALLESLAATAAIAIENARLYEQTRRDAETKATLLREVNHRVKNNLAAIIGLLYAEQQYPRLKNEETYQHFIRDLINRIHGLATAHHLLSEAQWLPLPLSSLVEQIISSALQALPLDKHVSVAVSPSQVRIGPKQANELALVINELTTNTMKYGLLERQTARIEVQIAQEGEVIQLQFRDDGPGYTEAVLQAKQHNVGIYLIQTMVSRGLEGEVTLHNDQGAVTNIRFRVIS